MEVNMMGILKTELDVIIIFILFLAGFGKFTFPS